jgi:hypothetical protein
MRYADDWEKLILSDEHDCFSFHVFRLIYLNGDDPIIVQDIWKTFSERPCCRQTFFPPEEALSMTNSTYIVFQFGCVLAHLKLRPEFRLNEFVAPISVNEHPRSEKDIKARFVNAFSAKFIIRQLHREIPTKETATVFFIAGKYTFIMEQIHVDQN